MPYTASSDSRRRGTRRVAVLAWMRMLRVRRRLERALVEHLQHWDLSHAHFDILAQLGAAEGITQCELATRLLVTQGNICQLLDRMERRGLVCRVQEGRTNRLYLTADGRRLFEEVVPEQEEHIARQFAALTPEEQTQLLGLLRKLDRAAR